MLPTWVQTRIWKSHSVLSPIMEQASILLHYWCKTTTLFNIPNQPSNNWSLLVVQISLTKLLNSLSFMSIWTFKKALMMRIYTTTSQTALITNSINHLWLSLLTGMENCQYPIITLLRGSTLSRVSIKPICQLMSIFTSGWKECGKMSRILMTRSPIISFTHVEFPQGYRSHFNLQTLFFWLGNPSQLALPPRWLTCHRLSGNAHTPPCGHAQAT